MAANYVAMLSAEVCAIHNWSDGVNILRRVFSVQASSTVVTRCFKTQNEALCWLTDPVQTAAVADCATPADHSASPETNVTRQWVALVTHSMSSCVKVDATGIGITIGALRDVEDRACVVQRFPNAAEAWRWVGTSCARSLLDVVCWVPPKGTEAPSRLSLNRSAPVIDVNRDDQGRSAASLAAESTECQAASPAFIGGASVSAMATDARRSTKTIMPATPPAAEAAAPGFATLVASRNASACGPSTLRFGDGAASSTRPRDASLSGRRGSTPASRRTTGSATASAATARHLPHGARAPRTSNARGSSSVRAPAAMPTATQGCLSAGSVGRGGTTKSSLAARVVPPRPLGRPRARPAAPSARHDLPTTARDACPPSPLPGVLPSTLSGGPTLSSPGIDDPEPFDDDAWERELDDVSRLVEEDIRRAEVREAAEARPSKRSKPNKTMPGEPSSDLNPPSSADDDRTRGMFSLSNIRSFMAEHHAEWKELQVSGQEPPPRRWGPSERAMLARKVAGSRRTACAGGGLPGAEGRAPTSGSNVSVPGWPLSDSRSSEDIELESVVAGASAPPAPTGEIGRLAAVGEWDTVCDRLLDRAAGAFVSGGPGVGKSTFLKRLHGFLKSRFAAEGEVVVLAPTGTSAKTAGGMTYHSFFGFGREYKPVEADPADEAARLLGTRRFGPIKERLCRVRAVLLDEISLVNAANLDVMYHLLRQARPHPAPPSLWFAFGDFLQLRPVCGAFAFTATTWSSLFGDALLELTTTYRQRDPGYVRAIQDARRGECSETVLRLVKDCGVADAKYAAVKTDVMHLMPLHKDVVKHNRDCLEHLCGDQRQIVSVAVDSVAIDKDRDVDLAMPNISKVSIGSRNAALSDCVAPKVVAHCLHARVLVTSNRMKHLGVCHGSAGRIVAYDDVGAPVVRFENHPPPAGIERGQAGMLDSGDTWIDLACPPVEFTARLFSTPGAVAVRMQVPFVLGWACTVHMSQSLTLSSAVLDLKAAFEAGMVHTALGRVSDKSRLYVKSFEPSRLFADQVALGKYREWARL